MRRPCKTEVLQGLGERSPHSSQPRLDLWQWMPPPNSHCAQPQLHPPPERVSGTTVMCLSIAGPSFCSVGNYKQYLL